jgi:hypothetical protein
MAGVRALTGKHVRKIGHLAFLKRMGYPAGVEMMNKLILFLILLIGVNCARSTVLFPNVEIDSSEPMFPIQYKYADIPGEGRIELSYYNNLGQGVCLYPNQWPVKSGKMGTASDGIILIIGQQRFPVDRVNTGYCPGCSTYVAPGETLRASIPYDVFHLPAEMVNEEKQLEFTSMAYRCRKRD